MANKSHPQTGPKTEAGKQISSKNAQQFGIFSKGYLAYENQEELEQQYRDLCQQWGAHDPTRQIIVQSLQQGAICAQRLAQSQKQIIDAQMQSPNVRNQFAELADIDPLMSRYLPSWFFQGADHLQKKTALFVDQVWVEANELKRHYSDALVAQVQTRYPNLYHYVMQQEKPGTSFVSIMGHRYKQNVPAQNLAVLMNEIKEKYEYHLIWAQDPERYEIYIAGIRGQQIAQGMDWDKTIRYSTAFQNQIIKACGALESMDRLEGKGIHAPALIAPTSVANVSPAVGKVGEQEIEHEVEQVIAKKVGQKAVGKRRGQPQQLDEGAAD
jgi:hypothetical protein